MKKFNFLIIFSFFLFLNSVYSTTFTESFDYGQNWNTIYNSGILDVASYYSNPYCAHCLVRINGSGCYPFKNNDTKNVMLSNYSFKSALNNTYYVYSSGDNINSCSNPMVIISWNNSQAGKNGSSMYMGVGHVSNDNAWVNGVYLWEGNVDLSNAWLNLTCKTINQGASIQFLGSENPYDCIFALQFGTSASGMDTQANNATNGGRKIYATSNGCKYTSNWVSVNSSLKCDNAIRKEQWDFQYLRLTQYPYTNFSEDIKKIRGFKLYEVSYAGESSHPAFIYNFTLGGIDYYYNNSLPSCNLTIPKNTCINATDNSINYNLTCSDLEQNTIYYAYDVQKNYIKEYVLNPSYLFDSYGYTWLDYNKYTEEFRNDIRFYNNLLPQNSSYCLPCFGAYECGLVDLGLYQNGIRLIDHKSGYNSMYALQLQGSQCIDKYNVMRYLFNRMVQNVDINYRFDIENNADSVDRFLKYIVTDEKINTIVSSYEYKLNSSDNKTLFYRYNVSAGAYDKLFEYNSYDASGYKIYFGVIDRINLKTNNETITYYYRSGSTIYNLYNVTFPDLALRNATNIFAVSFQPYIINFGNMTFYVGDLYAVSNQLIDSTVWSETKPQIKIMDSDNYNIRFYVTDDIHKSFGVYNVFESQGYIPKCEEVVKINLTPNLDTGLKITKEVNFALCNMANVIQTANPNNHNFFDTCIILMWVLFIISYVLGILIGVAIGLAVHKWDFIFGLTSFFTLGFIIIFSVIVDYEGWMQIITGIYFAFGVMDFIRVLMFSNVNTGGEEDE